jgi:hypothetical protein
MFPFRFERKGFARKKKNKKKGKSIREWRWMRSAERHSSNNVQTDIGLVVESNIFNVPRSDKNRMFPFRFERKGFALKKKKKKKERAFANGDGCVPLNDTHPLSV